MLSRNQIDNQISVRYIAGYFVFWQDCFFAIALTSESKGLIIMCSQTKKMKKANFNKVRPDRSLLAGKRNYFVGDVILHDISKDIGMTDQKVYYAAFKNGARTKMHFHEGSQTLVVTHGTGLLVTFRKKGLRGRKVKIAQEARLNLKSGDVAYIPKRTLHLHGAKGGKDFGHVAFNGFSSNGREAKTMWYDSDFRSYATKIQ